MIRTRALLIIIVSLCVALAANYWLLQMLNRYELERQHRVSH